MKYLMTYERMADADIHFGGALSAWDGADKKKKKKIGEITGCDDREDLVDTLHDMGYEEITDIEDEISKIH